MQCTNIGRPIFKTETSKRVKTSRYWLIGINTAFFENLLLFGVDGEQQKSRLVEGRLVISVLGVCIASPSLMGVGKASQQEKGG